MDADVPSHSVSESNTLHDNLSTKSEQAHSDDAEEGIEEAFGPARDEEARTHQDGGHHPATVPTPDLVDWDGPDDPENPLNWPQARKVWIAVISALMTFVVSFGSSVFSTATQVTAARFHVSSEVMILGVTLYVVGFACGPLVWGPLSEIYGRRPPLMIGFFLFILCQIPIAVGTDLQTILMFRFFAGATGSAPLAITPGTFVDYFGTVERAIASMGYAGAVFAGPSAGPIIGEFTVKNANLGWRWTAWFTMIMAAVFFIPAVLTVPETLAPIILQKKAARLRRETKNWALHSKLDEQPVEPKALLQKYGLKPMQMIIHEPILIIFTVYISLVYGILYLIFFAYPYSFEFDRGMESGISSLPFIAIFVGVVLGCSYMAWETKAIFQPKFVKAKKLIPEERLPPMMIGSVVLVIGLFWFAWTSFPSISPWPQIISGVFIGAGIMLVFMPAIVYLIDVYLYEANSALAANAFVRSFTAAVFPLFSTYLYKGLGVQWATSLLAFLCVALIPGPILFYVYGAKIRSWSKFAINMDG